MNPMPDEARSIPARWAANVSLLFAEVPLRERFDAAARAGFRSVEIQFPYAIPAAELRTLLDASGLALVLHNLPAGDFEAGERGTACDPARVAEFRAGVRQGIAYAQALGVPRLNTLAGIVPRAVEAGLARRTLVDNLRWAARELAAADLVMLVEPLNRFDVPGYAIDRPSAALELIAEVGAPNLLLQLDLYHAQRSEGELAATIERALPLLGHVQVADNPGRHEPGSGEIHYPFVFAALARLGYGAHVGCEYLPAAGTEAGLGWLDDAMRRLP